MNILFVYCKKMRWTFMCCWGLCFLPQAQAQVFDGIVNFNASVLESTCLLSIAMESSGDRLGNGLSKKLDFLVKNNNACSRNNIFQLSFDSAKSQISFLDGTLYLENLEKEGVVTAMSINFLDEFSLQTLEIGDSKTKPQPRSNTTSLKMGHIPLFQNVKSSIVVRLVPNLNSKSTQAVTKLPLLIDYK